MTEETTTPVEDTESAAIDPDAEQTDNVEPEGDTFDRKYVEKLRQESAKHRTAATSAESALAAIRGQMVDEAATAAGIKPAALRAVVTDVNDLLTESGVIDTAKMKTAIQQARDTLGITQPSISALRQKGFQSGASGGHDDTGAKPAFEQAFRRPGGR